MTAIVNIKAQSNANLNLKVRSSYLTDGLFVDFEGYKADMEIRERKNGYTVLATLSSYQPADGTITFEPNGVFALDLSPTVLTNKVKPGIWYYDIVITRSDGVEVRWMEGLFYVDSSTTIENLSTL